MHGSGLRFLRRVVLGVAAVLVVAGRVGAADKPHAGKPFQRAMIFTGLGTDFVPYIGMYDAAVDAGRAPDLIIGTSGGAVAAAIIAAFPDPAARGRFLASPEFHQFLLSISLEQTRPVPLLAQLLGWFPRSRGLALRPPDLFNRVLASFPAEPPSKGIDIPFPAKAGDPRIVLVAGRLDYASSRALRAGRKLFTETWFTDPDTATHLRGLASPVGAAYPRSAVAREPAVVTEASVFSAMRASAMEPHVFAPACVQGRWYTGGGIDLWPVEMASAVAEETVVPQLGKFGPLVETLLRSVFEYSQWDRWEQVERFPAAARVDLADNRRVLTEASFWFGFRRVRGEAEVQAVAAGQPESRRVYLIPRKRIADPVPEAAAAFYHCVLIQHAYGYERTRQALAR